MVTNGIGNVLGRISRRKPSAQKPLFYGEYRRNSGGPDRSVEGNTEGSAGAVPLVPLPSFVQAVPGWEAKTEVI